MGPSFQHPFQAHDHSIDLVHPGAPAGGCGPGLSRLPSPTCGSASVTSLPHTGSPAGRHLDWHGALDAVDLPARVAAVHRAITGANAYLPKALFDATGHELHQIVAGILPGLLLLMAVLAATTTLGAAAGAAIGALAFGVGAAPGAAVGAGLGFEAGLAILNFLGIAFLAAYIGQSLMKATKLAAHAVSLAWQSVDRPETQRRAAVDEASKTLAAAAAELLRGVLQGVVAFLLAKGAAAAASRVPELAAKLRSSKLGATFAEWIERNWSELINNPKLKDAPASPPVASSPPPAPRSAAPKATKTPADPPPVAPKPAAPVAAPASFLKPRLPKTELEPGAVPGPVAPTINPMPTIPDGFPSISQSEVNTFAHTPTAEVLPEGTKLYRVVGDGSNPAGSFWARDLPATEAQWRSDSAVLGQWNGDGGYVEYTVPPGGLPAWTGEAAAQPAALPGYVLKGGGDQVVIPPNTITPSAPIPTPWSGG